MVPLVVMVWVSEPMPELVTTPAMVLLAAVPTIVIEPDCPAKPAVIFWLRALTFAPPRAPALPRTKAFAPLPVIEISCVPWSANTCAPPTPPMLM